MFKKYWKMVIIILVFVVSYLLAAHYYIYHSIGAAGLKATDDRHVYVINEKNDKSRGLVYVSVGDSLTAGVGSDKYENSYPFLLAQKMAVNERMITNINFSYPGARTSDVIKDFVAGTVAERPDIITLMIGTNDVHGMVGVKQFGQNIDLIISEFKSKTTAHVNIIGIPFIGNRQLLLPPYNYYINYRIARFNDELRLIATRHGVNFIDLAAKTRELQSSQDSYYSVDKFHPSNLGYRIWSEYIYAHLDR